MKKVVLTGKEMWRHLSDQLNVNDYPHGAPTVNYGGRYKVYLPGGEAHLDSDGLYFTDQFDHLIHEKNNKCVPSS